MVATLKTGVIQEPSSGTANLTLDASGGVTVGQNLTVTGTTTFTGGSTFTGNATAAAFIPSGSTVPTNGLYRPAVNTVGLATNSTNALYIDASQNVGIGTTSPLSQVDVYKVSSSGGGQIRLSGNTNAAYGELLFASNNNTYSTYGASIVGDGAGTGVDVGQLIFKTANGAARTERMRIDPSGNVGIGTSSPAYKLSVLGTIYAYNTSNAFLSQDTTGGAWFANAFAGNYVITQSGVSERMRIDTSGNLLVGTTTAQATVTVYHAGNQKSADFYAVGNASGTTVMSLRKGVNDATTANVYVQFLYNNGSTGAGQINGNGGSQAAFGSYSDVRLKENIQPLSGELEKVCSLRPVEFDYKDGNGHQIGFIAQEVQTIYPDVVSVGENEMLTVTGWNKTEARLVQAIKELTAKVTALEAKVGAN